jgi:hypothetical protein
MKESINKLQLTASIDRYTGPTDNDDLFTRSQELPQSAEAIHGLADGLERSPHLSGPLFDPVLLVDWSLSGSRPFWRIHIIVNYYWPVYSTINKTPSYCIWTSYLENPPEGMPASSLTWRPRSNCHRSSESFSHQCWHEVRVDRRSTFLSRILQMPSSQWREIVRTFDKMERNLGGK